MPRRRRSTSACLLTATALALTALTPAQAGQAAQPADRLPRITPEPQSVRPTGADARVTRRVTVGADERTDPAALRRLVRELEDHGAARVDVVAPDAVPRATGRLTVRLGAATRSDLTRALAGTSVPDRAEGYALRADGGTVALAGADATGQFYAVQSLRQLFQPTGTTWRIAGTAISDHPAMPLRGTVEGFYGTPWTHAERLDQMDFHGDVKANTYIYAPKDDPYHRDKWREPYPEDKAAELGELVERADANHVRFTFAVSPGTSICYSDPDHVEDLTAKLQALHDLGTRSFSIPLDDIDYTSWNCEADRAAYGEPGRASAARAQSDLLNHVQRTFVAAHEGTRPLQTVPTEYGDLTDTAYKQTLRDELDAEVEVMWTGTDVVPPEITNDQAAAASALFGRKVFVWDNYPVNDFGNTSGRLLLAPYDRREPGLSDHLTGIVANPMNQPYAGKAAVFGAAAFSWNDTAYDAKATWHAAMSYLAGGDLRATDALLLFGDLNHLAPTFGDTPWQPQAPELSRRTAAFWQSWDAGDEAKAVRALRPYADALAQAPATIRSGKVQPGFVTDAAPWLDATALWGRATVTMTDALDAWQRGDRDRARELAGESRNLQDQARAVRVAPPRNSWGEVQPKIADGVLDTFLTEAAARLA
ncbi:beta-N-acetylglucosaminidase domain-containing protein [Streptomyces albidoflavus]|uniref:beta-N-acetylglucosaminidase domain-containing protein n=1 Tax=Streptomyces TaxID=1883 RepID=UPI001E5533D9|nr:beta-N-acetylglucosaminidase domain-containing protein [Streptomyces sp. OUCMDZ-3434]WSB22195.1 beta-N-acetylglucosaminidase domain-containing protein [Streptomyces albidoflavus]